MGKRSREGFAAEAPKKKRKPVGAKTGQSLPRTKNTASKPTIVESFVQEQRFPLAVYGYQGALLVKRTWVEPPSWSYQLGYCGERLHGGFYVQVVKGWSSYQTKDQLFRVAVATGISRGCNVGGISIAVGVPTIMVLLNKAPLSERVLIVVTCAPKVGIRLHRPSLLAEFDEKVFEDFGHRALV